MSATTFLEDKVLPNVMKVVNAKPITAIKNGMMQVMPFTIIGSVFLLLANIPIPAVQQAISNAGLEPFLYQAFGSSFGIMAFIAVMGIASAYVKAEGFDGQQAGFIALCVFVLLMLPSVTTADGLVVGDVISKEWTAGKGMVMAIVAGLFCGWIYSWFLKRDIRIKLPESVPPMVANSFAALIPGAVLITGATVIFALCYLNNTTLFDLVYIVVQTPLSGLTDSFGGVVAMGFLIPFLWFFGIHGSSIVSGVMGPILQANAFENEVLFQSGIPLTVANGGRIVTQQFLDQFMTVTGAGITIGVALYMVAFAKAKEYKTLGRLSIGPAFFNINEPILFATPIVMNPIMALPFFLAPIASGAILYACQYIGLVPLFRGVLVPWTTPPIISGLLVGGIRMALLQLVCLAVTCLIYLPFIKKMDDMAYKAELEQA